MDFNIQTEVKQSPIKTASLILAGLVFVIMIWTSISSSSENKRLKTAIKDKEDKIETLEESKIPLLEGVKKDSLELIRREDIIRDLSEINEEIKKTLKYYKYENKKLKNNYVNSTLDERILQFSRLATEKDSIK